MEHDGSHYLLSIIYIEYFKWFDSIPAHRKSPAYINAKNKL